MGEWQRESWKSRGGQGPEDLELEALVSTRSKVVLFKRGASAGRVKDHPPLIHFPTRQVKEKWEDNPRELGLEGLEFETQEQTQWCMENNFSFLVNETTALESKLEFEEDLNIWQDEMMCLYWKPYKCLISGIIWGSAWRKTGNKIEWRLTGYHLPNYMGTSSHLFFRVFFLMWII